MSRGILSTIYVRLANGASADDLRATLAKRYEDEPFVRVLGLGQAPQTRQVRGANHCLIGVSADRVEGSAIVMAVISNLMQGASAQEIQHINQMAGCTATSGTGQHPITHKAE